MFQAVCDSLKDKRHWGLGMNSVICANKSKKMGAEKKVTWFGINVWCQAKLFLLPGGPEVVGSS